MTAVNAWQVAASQGRDQKASIYIYIYIVHGSRKQCRVRYEVAMRSFLWLKTMGQKIFPLFKQSLSCCAASVWRYFMPPDKAEPPSIQGRLPISRPFSQCTWCCLYSFARAAVSGLIPSRGVGTTRDISGRKGKVQNRGAETKVAYMMLVHGLQCSMMLQEQFLYSWKNRSLKIFCTTGG